jgi:hypothetical protein
VCFHDTQKHRSGAWVRRVPDGSSVRHRLPGPLVCIVSIVREEYLSQLQEAAESSSLIIFALQCTSRGFSISLPCLGLHCTGESAKYTLKREIDEKEKEWHGL